MEGGNASARNIHQSPTNTTIDNEREMHVYEALVARSEKAEECDMHRCMSNESITTFTASSGQFI